MGDEKKLTGRLTKRFHKAIFGYSLIEDGDKILIGLSGGKDSLFLLEMLGRRMRILKPRFTVEALHVRMSNIRYDTDTTYLEAFAAEHGIRLHVKTTSFDDRQSSKPPCFLCSWYRRKMMFQTARELGCNKIALGHHMDDIIHTAMLNQYFEGHFSTMPVRLSMRKMPIVIIRPLCLEHEADIAAYARLHHYEKQLKTCPFEKSSNRTFMRQIFEQIERINPEARYSVWNALQSDGKLVQTSDGPVQ